MEGKALSGMALLRIISGVVEIVAAAIILRLHRVEYALRLNALLGVIGPLVFISVSALGLTAVAVKLSPVKIACTLLGILFVFWGTKG